MEAINFNDYYYRGLGYNNYNSHICQQTYTYENRDLDRVEESKELKAALQTIRESVEDENEDVAFYNLLISLAMTQKDKKIIEGIIEDEKRHNKMLREIYYELTGVEIPQVRDMKNMDNLLNYRNNLEKALFGELDAVKKYRKVMAAMPDKKTYAKIMEIMTDELRHANIYNFLLTSSRDLM